MEDVMPKEIKLIAVYARVSTSNQENEGTIETQLSAVREFAQRHGHTIVREYHDAGWSGDTLGRPALDQLRMDAKQKIWEAVLMYDPDRLARRYSYQELVMDELWEAGIECLFVTIPAPKNSEDKILYGVRGLFAEYERAKIAERFRFGKVRKVREGHVLTTEAPYGYTYIPKKDKVHGYYEINEEEARVVRMIFSWIADEGVKLRSVVRKLQEMGIKPRRSKRGVWNTSTLSTLLRNKVYIGEAHWGSSYAVVPENPLNKEKYKKIKKTSRRMKPEAEWIAAKIPVPAIIDRDLFMRARAQLEQNFALCQRNKKNEYLLGGKIRCVCGRTRSGEGPQQGKHLYYRCTDRVSSYPLPRTCKEGGINARIADKLVWEKIAELMSSPELLQAQLDRWLKAQKDRENLAVFDVEAAGKEIKKLKAQEDRYAKAYGAEALTIEQLKQYTAPIRERVSALETELMRARQQEDAMRAAPVPDAEEIRRFAEASVQTLAELSFAEKRAIVINVLDKVVATQEKLEVYGCLPIPSSYVKYKPEDRHCRTAERRQVHAF